MKVKVNLPKDMDEIQDILCKIMAESLVNEYGCEKVRQALSILKKEEHSESKIISQGIINN